MRITGLVLTTLWLANLPAGGQEPSLTAVSLAPSLTELVFALGLGDRLVGRSSACDYPPEALALPVLGDFGRPNQEALLAAHPDLVLATDLEKPGLRGYLEGQGIKVLVLSCENWTGLLDTGRAVARELGDAEAGIRWAQDMEVRRTAIEQRANTFWAGRERPSVYIEIWSDPPMTAGKESFANDLVTLAGGRNIGAALDRSYANASSEWILAQDPDVIVLAYMTTNAAAERLAQRPGWDRLRAVREDHVCAGINPDWLLRPGPRMLDGAEALSEWLMKTTD
ncbi:MAG TPA: cobalamin-binding protein [Kiritimatiellia bacterium]|nr:cobalamin-binding protein [Kiritimatiellia bacterium]HRZ12085.1 cobalamin-binding protein [Kiritimatiellia bacterium]HSA18157.1 cobalamin-binding protein [Kiritimatiellia bacterium]